MVDTTRIKARIREIGKTQEDVAGELGINPSTLNRKINNVEGETLTVKEANRLAEILKIEESDFLRYFFAKKLA